MKTKNEIGNRYGLLTVIGLGEIKYRRYFWTCMCDCGSIVVVDGNHLRMGHTKSCGCHKSIRHGSAYTEEYAVWMDMRNRCSQKSNRQYKDYGGRGISICERWERFENFISDMGKRPNGYTLDRIDNNAGYSPENCRWATRKQQQRNRRNNRIITHNGVSHCLVEWSEITGIPYQTLITRLDRGWDVDRALTEETHRK